MAQASGISGIQSMGQTSPSLIQPTSSESTQAIVPERSNSAFETMFPNEIYDYFCKWLSPSELGVFSRVSQKCHEIFERYLPGRMFILRKFVHENILFSKVTHLPQLTSLLTTRLEVPEEEVNGTVQKMETVLSLVLKELPHAIVRGTQNAHPESPGVIQESLKATKLFFNFCGHKPKKLFEAYSNIHGLMAKLIEFAMNAQYFRKENSLGPNPTIFFPPYIAHLKRIGTQQISNQTIEDVVFGTLERFGILEQIPQEDRAEFLAAAMEMLRFALGTMDPEQVVKLANVLEETFDDALPLYEIFIKLVMETMSKMKQEEAQGLMQQLQFPQEEFAQIVQRAQERGVNLDFILVVIQRWQQEGMTPEEIIQEIRGMEFVTGRILHGRQQNPIVVPGPLAPPRSNTERALKILLIVISSCLFAYMEDKYISQGRCNFASIGQLIENLRPTLGPIADLFLETNTDLALIYVLSFIFSFLFVYNFS